MDENPILEHFNAPYHRGPLATATHSGYARNAACGDEVTVYAEIRDSKIVECSFVASGCMVCQAAASILCEHIQSQDIQNVATITPQEALNLIGVPLTPRRQLCGLLPHYALQTLLSTAKEG
jgi:nitrogen fixation NifU-like protein